MLPVYQMSYINPGNLSEGLCFPSELPYDYFGDSMFLIPIDYYEDENSLVKFLKKSQFYFPILLNDKQDELIGKFKKDKIVFVTKNNTPISFNIDFETYFENQPQFGLFKAAFGSNKDADKNFIDLKILDPTAKLSYKGNHRNLIIENNGFLPIYIEDYKILDELYDNEKLAFIGLTDQFGVLKKNDNIHTLTDNKSNEVYTIKKNREGSSRRHTMIRVYGTDIKCQSDLKKVMIAEGSVSYEGVEVKSTYGIKRSSGYFTKLDSSISTNYKKLKDLSRKLGPRKINVKSISKLGHHLRRRKLNDSD